MQQTSRTLTTDSTLVDILRARAQSHARRVAYVFLQDNGGDKRLSYEELDRRARSAAVLLRQHGATFGDRVLLLFSPGADYIVGFLGCLYAGCVAIPTYLPRSFRQDGTMLRRVVSIMDSASPFAALSCASSLSSSRDSAQRLARERGIRYLELDEAGEFLAEQWARPSIDAGTLAFLQYTSGSIGQPKGAMVTHGNVLHNSLDIHRCFETDPDTCGVSWLPPYHDMGLIGNILQALYVGCPLVLMSPVSFLQRPYRWLQAISKYRGTISGAPNFAYELCLRKTTEEQRATLDLSCWKVAYTGAEPVRAQTLERFAEGFAECGFRPEAFLPCYGLAEATLLVSGQRVSMAPTIRSFDAPALQNHEVRPAESCGGAASAVALVGCGPVAGGQDVRIVNPDTRAVCQEHQIGEIWIAGPAVARGYWREPVKTAETFEAHLATGEGPFMRTGDLGFLSEGELFVTGRRKDLIIIRGSNYYPQDIEYTVDQCHDAIRPGCGAAFSVEVDGEEKLVIVQEIELKHRAIDPSIPIAAVHRAISEQHGLAPHDVVLIKTGHIPKTSSGKIRRQQCKCAYLAGTLELLVDHGTRSGVARHDELGCVQ